MKLFAVAIKSLREQVRDYRTLGLSFLMPVTFMIIFGLAFGRSFYVYSISVTNQDGGELGKILTEELKTVCYDDGTPIFSVRTDLSDDAIRQGLEKHSLGAAVIIPEHFSAALQSAVYHDTIIVQGDPAYPSFSLAKMVFESVLNEFVAIRTATPPPIKSVSKFINERSGGSEFDYIAPGLMIFAVYMLLIQAAVALMMEIESGAILRLKLSGLSTWQLLGGVSLTQMIFAAVMVPLMVYSAVLVGFQSSGSLWDGIGVGVLTSFSAVALGLITAAFSKTVNQAFLLGNIIIVPVVFLSGVFFPLPNMTTLFTLAGHNFNLFDLQPASHAVSAFQQIFIYGANLSVIAYELWMLTGFTVVYFIAGVLLFRRFHLK